MIDPEIINVDVEIVDFDIEIDDFDIKIEEQCENKLSKILFFAFAFFNRFWDCLGRVLEQFWERFGASWRLLGHFLASFFGACMLDALQKGSWRVPG